MGKNQAHQARKSNFSAGDAAGDAAAGTADYGDGMVRILISMVRRRISLLDYGTGIDYRPVYKGKEALISPCISIR